MTSEISEFVAMGIHVTRTVINLINDDAANDPDGAFESIAIGRRSKKALRIDVNAEDQCRRGIRKYHNGAFKKIEFFGEESLADPTLDLSSSQSVCVLADAVDGTDLLQRGFSNWCTALVFFAPSAAPGAKIIGSFVGLPSGEIFVASPDTVFMVNRGGDHRELRGCSDVHLLEESSICFYGQKIKNLLKTADFLRKLDSGFHANLRIYNLAGIPMMLKVVDVGLQSARGIDVVFDVSGQQPHDCVPGLYIAKRAGACLKTIEGDDLTYEKLEAALLRPAADRIRYVLAANADLANSVIKAFSFASH